MTSPRFSRLNVVWELPDSWCEVDHLARALAEVERHFAAHDLTDRFIFVVTAESERLPIKHRDRVVVVQTSDEGHGIPAYLDDAFMVFKIYRPFAPLPGNLRIIPLGCNQDVPAVPPKDMAARATDVFFIGRAEFRDDFFAAALPLNRKPGLAANIALGPTFREGISPQDYGALLADTKIALAPRGVSHETFRIYEALRAGCVVLAARQLPGWWSDGWPVIELDDWSGLEARIDALLADPAHLADLSARGREWWRERCSPEAVGRYMVGEIAARLTGG